MLVRLEELLRQRHKLRAGTFCPKSPKKVYYRFNCTPQIGKETLHMASTKSPRGALLNSTEWHARRLGRIFGYDIGAESMERFTVIIIQT